MFNFLIPAAILSWVAETVKAKIERWAGLADRQMDQMEAELESRRLFTGTVIPVVNRLEAIPETNGKKKR